MYDVHETRSNLYLTYDGPKGGMIGRFRQIGVPEILRTVTGVSLLTLFGLVAVSAMLLCYAFERRSHWFVLGFAAACVAGSAYGFLQGAWPFGLVEAIWSGIAVRRWWLGRPK